MVTPRSRRVAGVDEPGRATFAAGQERLAKHDDGDAAALMNKNDPILGGTLDNGVPDTEDISGHAVGSLALAKRVHSSAHRVRLRLQDATALCCTITLESPPVLLLTNLLDHLEFAAVETVVDETGRQELQRI
ncbi:hypothetical protein ZHAS_00013729 [Anopheles sinensis]|uniref:Uncharacterized protein n=1 Tax=Anopheles sinensis TaxID=74873 RepID=A0A084W6B2_ANOSI|nr:hypothetical protein ZHAS_00013729 [Anopheles sinensis]